MHMIQHFLSVCELPKGCHNHRILVLLRGVRVILISNCKCHV
jgi:hypothetical protein